MTLTSIHVALLDGETLSADILRTTDGAFIKLHLSREVSMYLAGYDAEAVQQARLLAVTLIDAADRIARDLTSTANASS